MTYSILFTSLYFSGKDLSLRYYCAKDGARRLYTDVMLTAEAAAKHLLSSAHIDEIIVLGRYMTYDEGDDEKTPTLEEGKVFYNTNIRDLSTYSLFRYRLAQFRDDLRLDQDSAGTLLSKEEQKQIEDFIRKFYKSHDDGSESTKFNRFFDRLAADDALLDEMVNELVQAIPNVKKNEDACMKWIRNFLYTNLRDFSKISILEENENVKLRFIPTEVDENGSLPMETMLKLAAYFTSKETDDIRIYMALNSDDMTDNFVMLGVLSILDMLNKDKIKVERVCSPTDAYNRLAGMIRENKEGYDISTLTNAVTAFLKYGKADMIVDLWKQSGSENEQVKKMVSAMQRIDNGLSLCNITDIEKGISDLRELFRNGFTVEGTDYYSKLFILLSKGIQDDYGRIVTADDADFIDRIKWAYSKGFLQQCLTLIESKAPAAIVAHGMFYYCNDENDKPRVTNFFAVKLNEMRSSETWKMNDVDHYFIKYFFRNKYSTDTNEHQRKNAQNQMTCLDNTDPQYLTGYTACDDRQLLEDLLFAYIHVGVIRNETNHASDEQSSSESLFQDDDETSSRLTEIKEAIAYFIQSYDAVLENVRDKNPTVVRITGAEVKSAAKKLKKAGRSENRTQNSS